MSNTLRVTVDPATVRPSTAIRGAAQAAPCLVLGQGALVDLAAELGGMEAAAAFLLEVAESVGRPIGVNLQQGDGSQTMFVAPRTWSVTRLQGWVAGHHGELESEFGEIAGLRTERGGVQNGMG